jgi:hypothetical protein
VPNLPLSAHQPELIEYDRHQWGAIGSGGCGKRCIERPQAVGGHPAAPPAGSPKETPRLQTPSIMYRQGRTVSTPWLRMCCPRGPVTGRLSGGIDPVPTATDAECWAGATIRCHARRCVPGGADPSHRGALCRPDLDAVALLPAGAIAWPHPHHLGHAVGAWGCHAQVGSAAGLVGGLAHQPMPFEEPLDGPDLRPGPPAQRVARLWEGQHTALGIRGCHEPWPNVTNQRFHLRGGFARQPRGGTRVVLGPRRVGGAYRVRHVASQYWGRPSARPIALAGVPGRERRRASRRS